MAFTLKQVVPWGRSFEEYVRMFNLTKKDLQKKILGCGDGPASFNAEMKKRGFKVVSCDPIYSFTTKQIKSRIDKTHGLVMKQLMHNKHDYVWKTFKTPENVGRKRMQAMYEFLLDYDRGKSEGRYVAECLPKMYFKDNQFDMVLCAHFLFLYTNHFSLSFHIKAIKEMLRIAKEVRIFPLLELGGRKSPYIEDVMEMFKQKGYNVTIPNVNYEFQRGGNRMLKVSRF